MLFTKQVRVYNWCPTLVSNPFHLQIFNYTQSSFNQNGPRHGRLQGRVRSNVGLLWRWPYFAFLRGWLISQLKLVTPQIPIKLQLFQSLHQDSPIPYYTIFQSLLLIITWAESKAKRVHTIFVKGLHGTVIQVECYVH